MTRRTSRMFRVLAVCLAFGCAEALAQEPQTGQPPAHIALVDGSATLEREGRADTATVNLPLLHGDRLRTDAGRVELLLGDGSALYLDYHTQVDLQSDTLIRLMAGRVTLRVRGAEAGQEPARYLLDTPAGSVRTSDAGVYRVSLLTAERRVEVELAVVRGRAELVTSEGAMAVRAGERSVGHDGEKPSAPQAFNSARLDAFDQWAEPREEGVASTRSYQYLSPEVQSYARTFDQHGNWAQMQPYGYVWYPSVAPGWRPYYNGYWNVVGRYGWTWIGSDPWAWPTHHFGRWGYSRTGTWFWIPARQWAPAWVHWAISPGYVSWCPLGFDGRPVLDLWSRSAPNRFADPWNAWTLLPLQALGQRAPIPSAAVDGRRVAPDPRSFIVQQAPPPFRAAGHITGPASVPTGTAVPRTGVDPRAAASLIGGAVLRPSIPPTHIQETPPPYAAPYSYANPAYGAQPSAYPYPSPYPYGGPAYGYPSRADSPYERAARVAAERYRTLPAPGPGDTSGAPYPPQFRTSVPEPFRPAPTGGYPPDDPYARAAAVARSRGAGMVITAPPGSSPLPYPPPYNTTIVYPRVPAPETKAEPRRKPPESKPPDQ